MEEPPSPAHLRLKAGTAVVTVALTIGLLLFDWDAASGGPKTVFSSVRPTIKATLNRLYGRDRAPVGAQQQQQQQEQQQPSQQH
jgi:hypothetical protein